MKAHQRKIRGGSDSPLTALKALAKKKPEVESMILGWAADAKNTNAAIRGMIRDRYSIALTRDTQLSSFYSWCSLKAQFEEDENTTQTLLEEIKQDVSNISDEELDKIGLRTFSLLALRKKDPETFLKYRSAMTKGQIEKAKLQLAERAELRQAEALKLDVERFQFDGAKAAITHAMQIKTIVANKTFTESEKIQKVRQLLFGQLPA